MLIVTDLNIFTFFLSFPIDFSLNRCDVKLKQFWVIDLLLLHWVLVWCIFPRISFLFSLFFPGYWLKSTKKMVKGTLSRFLSSEFEESFHNLSSDEWCRESTSSSAWTTLPLTITLVSMFWNSAENSPCKVNVFTKRYTALVKEWDYIHDALLFTTLKKPSHKVTQLISFLF